MDIINAGLALINESGLHNTTMAMIAEKADVGMGTIYRYFEDKNDIINEIYIHVKEEEASIIFENDIGVDNLKSAFFYYYGRMIDYFRFNPQRFNFLSIYAFSPLIRNDTKVKVAFNFYKFNQIYNRGLELEIFKSMTADHLSIFVFSIISGWLKSIHSPQIVVSEDEKSNLLLMAWDSIKR